MSKMKDVLADVEQSLLDGIPADQLEKWLEARGHHDLADIIGWWHEQRLDLVQWHHDNRDTCGLCKRLTRAESYALLRPEDQPDDLAGGAA